MHHSNLGRYARFFLHSPIQIISTRAQTHVQRGMIRPFSTSTASNSVAMVKMWAAIIGTVGIGSLVYFYASDTRSAIHAQGWFMPLVHTLMDAEESHQFAIWLSKPSLFPLVPKEKKMPTQEVQGKLKVKLFGKEFTNPVGLAAGFDKNAEAIDTLLDLGFGLVEIGSVTPEPQAGNPKPRFFRLNQDDAVINRYGFNSLGHAYVQDQLRARLRCFLQSQHQDSNTADHAHLPHPRSLRPMKGLGVNLGKNKTSPADSHQDYVKGVQLLGPFADYIVINISSPNTPGLRSLQRREPMQQLLQQVKQARNKHVQHGPPLLVKIAPDVTDEELHDIAAVVQQEGIDGVIISNTTLSRPSFLASDPALVQESGGLSGKPLKSLSLSCVRKFYALTHGTVPIIGCGGISSGRDAVEFAKAGASAIQLYTSLGYQGPGLVTRLKQEIVDELKQQTWQDVIGQDHRNK